ncbi:hypothetical protein BDY19DRAFT_997543 [Irpex rosettiformis]|uniref:Uncharacterized protein n=1 Tax=Irpex rosettiformis TaxID=378272 RepID=A0ACB8TRZ8_9APHY|nr:hypothetical protein BDY19DRAFT_997543 [Irpex rosettiformis]
MNNTSSNVPVTGLPSGAAVAMSLPPLDNTLGAILIAEILVSMLFGMTTLQIYVYFSRNPRDSLWMKGVMIVLWILDALHLILTSHTLYHYAVLNYMNPLSLTICPWSFAVDMMFGGLNEILVTAIFAYRIWKFSGKLWPVMLIIPPTLVGFAGAAAIGNFALKVPIYEEFKQHYAWIWYLTFSAQSVADIAIAATLTAILIKRRTGFHKTDSIIRTLIVYSINTCALTSSASLASIITYAVMPNNFIFIAFAMVLPKLMLNSLLALLNSRDSIRDKNRSEPLSIHLSQLTTASVPDEPPRLSGSTRNVFEGKNESYLSGIAITTDKVASVSSV